MATSSPKSPSWADAFRRWAQRTFPSLPDLAALSDDLALRLLTDPDLILLWIDQRAMLPPEVERLGYPPDVWRAIYDSLHDMIDGQMDQAWAGWIAQAPRAARDALAPPVRRLIERGLLYWWKDPEAVAGVIARGRTAPYPLLAAAVRIADLDVQALFAACDALAGRAPAPADRARGAFLAAMALLYHDRGQAVWTIQKPTGQPGSLITTAAAFLEPRADRRPAVVARLLRDWDQILPVVVVGSRRAEEIRPVRPDWPLDLHVVRFKDQGVSVMPAWYQFSRQRAASRLADRAALPPDPVPRLLRQRLQRATVDGHPLNPSQVTAALRALTAPLSVITGGPGTGKTTICRIIADVVRARGGTILGFAPTGIAARRLEQLTGIPSSTIHRALIPGGYIETGGMARCDVAVVDEASMLDARTFEAVLAAAHGQAAHLVIVGDPDQLPPVEGTDPFIGLLAALDGTAVPVTHLTTVYRHDPIALNARYLFDETPAWSWNATVMAQTLPAWESADPMPDAWRDAVLDWVRARLAAGDRWQVLAPYRAHTNMLNGVVREAVVGNQPPMSPGDRVVQRENDYRVTQLRNGEQGVVTAGGSTVTAQFEGWADPHTVPIGYSLVFWAYAWALTVHKAQGGQWDHVLIVAPTHAQEFITRELLYTALTRVGAGTVTLLSDDPDAIVEGARRHRARRPRAWSYGPYLHAALHRKPPPHAGQPTRKLVPFQP
jgi:hypothetical protein